MNVVIVGGGITGLATARALVQGARAPVNVTLLEREGRLGGNIVTERRDGFVIDGGPDSWVATKPHATALARGLGLEGDLVPTVEATRKVYVAHGGALHPLPEGLVLAVPTRIAPVVTTRLFSLRGKLRMGLEPFVPRRDPSEGDESIAHFVSRRLGREMAERLAAPMLGGIYAGDADTLSVRATFPQFPEMEAKYGSLVRAMRAQRRGAKGKKAGSAFLSLRGGIGGLIEAVAKDLKGKVDVRTRTAAREVTRLLDGDPRGRFAVETAGDVVYADHVVLASPAHVAANLLRPLDATIAGELEGISYVSTATVFLAFRREDVAHPLDGVGFIVPRAEGRPILAGTWVSSKWAGRAPEGHVLVRAFFGGAGGEELLERDDAGLVALARGELAALMGLRAEPEFTRVFRFDRASPQMKVGHLDRMARVHARLEEHPGLHVAGGGYDGVGIPDCVKQGETVAGRILAS